MRNSTKDWLSKSLPAIIAVAVLIGIILTWAMAYGQEPVVVVGEPLPDDIDTWEELLAYWWPKAVNGALLAIGTVVMFAINRLAAQIAPVVPTIAHELISEKRKRDLHSGVMTIVSRMIVEKRWPTVTDMEEAGRQVTDGMLKELRDALMESNPQAADFAEVMTNKGMDILRNIGIRKGIEVQSMLGQATGVVDVKMEKTR